MAIVRTPPESAEYAQHQPSALAPTPGFRYSPAPNGHTIEMGGGGGGVLVCLLLIRAH